MAKKPQQVNSRLSSYEQDKLKYIQKITGKNQSDAVRMAIIHFADDLKAEADRKVTS